MKTDPSLIARRIADWGDQLRSKPKATNVIAAPQLAIAD